jgi:hypothetical protein
MKSSHPSVVLQRSETREPRRSIDCEVSSQWTRGARNGDGHDESTAAFDRPISAGWTIVISNPPIDMLNQQKMEGLRASSGFAHRS